MAKPARRGPKDTPTEPLALGRYVAQAQCSGCHGADLSGNPDEDSPDLRKAVKKYSAAQWTGFFTTGEAHQGHPTHVMTRVIKDELKYLTKAEVQGLYTYLKTTKAAATPATP
jgi:mono/diheme cytochrome c family protein